MSYWGEPEQAPHKLVVNIGCMSVACPTITLQTWKAPHWMIDMLVVRASRQFTLQTRKAPHWVVNTLVGGAQGMQ